MAVSAWDRLSIQSNYGAFGQVVRLSADGTTLVAGSRGFVHVYKYETQAWIVVGLKERIQSFIGAEQGPMPEHVFYSHGFTGIRLL